MPDSQNDTPKDPLEHFAAVTPPRTEDSVEKEESTGAVVPPDAPRSSVTESTGESVAEPSKRKRQNVDYIESINAGYGLPDSTPIIAMPSNFEDEVNKSIDDSPNINMVGTPEGRHWAGIINESLKFLLRNGQFVASLESVAKHFKNENSYKGIPLTPRAPRHREKVNENLKGEAAVLAVTKQLGMGDLRTVYLWQSGFWITFKPPSSSTMIEFNRKLIADKIEYGRYSYGITFGNSTSYTVEKVVELALSHIWETSVKTSEIADEDLINHITAQDLHMLVYGFLWTMFPKGFRYSMACVDNPGKCNYVATDVIDIGKLHVEDLSHLSEWQLAHMSSMTKRSMDLASIERYKKELSSIQNERINLLDGDTSIYITLKTPTLGEYIKAGHRWIGESVDNVNKALGIEPDDDARNKYVTQHCRATAMRQYTHWVASIEINTNIIDDNETIEKTLDELSSHDEIRAKYFDILFDYIDRSAISVIGVPVFTCPKCGTLNKDTKEKHVGHTSIIPIDVIQIFFALHTQRLNSLLWNSVGL